MANAGTFRKGEKRPKQGKHGPPKANLELKAMILKALSDVGGEKYLAEQAEKSPSAFLALIGKVLPMQVTGGDSTDNPVEVSFRIVRPENTNRD